MKTLNRLLAWVMIVVLVLVLVVVPKENIQAAGTISLTTLDSTYHQDFNSLANSETSSSLPNGWDFAETGSNADGTYAAGTGLSFRGNTYSFGAAGSSERALGGLQTGTLIPVFGASFANNTGSAVQSLVITYTGEEWRLGTAGRTDQLTFEYSTNAASLRTGTWIGVPALNFITPDTSTSGIKDGNSENEHTTLSATISGLNIPHGTVFWIRWVDVDASGSDDGLAIDDFSLTPQGVVLPSLSINDVAEREGRGGVNTFVFTLNLSSPAQAGGVTFDITTANNSATDGDYIANSLTGMTIPAGSSTATFNVQVNDDSTVEADETFAVNITNVTGANVADAQGLGTIINDDTATAVATSGSPSTVGGMVTFTATVTEPGVGTPTGTVEFFDNGISFGAVVLGSGAQATLSTAALTTGSHNITAAYNGDTNFSGSVSPALTQVVEGPPSVSQITNGSGEVILENGHSRAAINQLLVIFNKDMNAGDAATAENYHLVRDGSPGELIDPAGVTYNIGTRTATLTIRAIDAPLSNGKYTLTVNNVLKDTLGAPIGADFVRVFYVDNGAPALASVITIQGSAAIINGATINVPFSSIDVPFNEDVYDPADNTHPDDVTNPANYLLIAPGPNTAFNTVTCDAGRAGDDVQIPTGLVTYSNNGGAGPFVATVQLNNGTALPNGTYRLFVCGTTSIVDLAGNALNNGADDQRTFTVLITAGGSGSSARRNPQTGFAPGVVTLLPEQPAAKAYADLGDLWIEIPKLGLKTSITGVPLGTDGWDVTWLHRQVGWLAGTAYPTWKGNTILTAHGYTADGNAGPFALLKNMSYDETIVIHLGGMKYAYAVRMNRLISPNNTYWLNKHEELDWITLITCQQYDEKTKSYRYRRVLRAVLISVEEE